MEPRDNSDDVERWFEDYGKDVGQAYEAGVMDEVAAYRSMFCDEVCGGCMSVQEFLDLAKQYGVIE